MRSSDELNELLVIVEKQTKQLETQNVQIQEQQKQMRKLLFEKQELSNEILRLNDELQKMSEKNEKLNNADLILIENRKLRNQINLSNQKATDQVSKANIAIKQAEEKEKNLDQIIAERVRSKVSKEVGKKERALDEKKASFEKNLRSFSWVTVAVLIFLALVIWGAYAQKQEAKRMLSEGEERIAKATKMESEIMSNVSSQIASNSTSDNSSKESSTPAKPYDQLKEEVDQLLEDSRSTNTREQNMSALQRYDSVKNDVEGAKNSITFKEYYDLKLQLRLTESNLKYFKNK